MYRNSFVTQQKISAPRANSSFIVYFEHIQMSPQFYNTITTVPNVRLKWHTLLTI